MAPCSQPSGTLRAAWPAAILDSRSARRTPNLRPGRRNVCCRAVRLPSRHRHNTEISLRLTERVGTLVPKSREKLAAATKHIGGDDTVIADDYDNPLTTTSSAARDAYIAGYRLLFMTS